MLYTETAKYGHKHVCMCVIRTQTVCVVECKCWMFTNTNEMHATWHQYQCITCRDFDSCLHSVLDGTATRTMQWQLREKKWGQFQAILYTALYCVWARVCWMCRLVLPHYSIMCRSEIAKLTRSVCVCMCACKNGFSLCRAPKTGLIGNVYDRNRKVLTTKRSGRLFITRVSLD